MTVINMPILSLRTTTRRTTAGLHSHHNPHEMVIMMKLMMIMMTKSSLTFIITLLLLLFSFRSTQGSGGGVFASCHKLLANSEGIIYSPNFPQPYPENLDCIYDIIRPHHDEVCGIRLTWDSFALEPPDPRDGFCKKDWLSIDHCVPEGGSRFCGNMSRSIHDYPLQPHAEAFRLIFHSDHSVISSGFQIQYKFLNNCLHGLYWNPPITTIPNVLPLSTPCFTQVTERKGTINTPYFPRNYGNDMDCVYEFIRESPFICGVRMRVLNFELENSIDTEYGGACLDFFHSPGCGFLCGKLKFLWTAKFQPGATSLKFHFHSDENSTYTGFQIAFEQVYDCY